MATDKELKIERRRSNQKLLLQVTRMAKDISFSVKSYEEFKVSIQKYQESNQSYHEKIDRVLNGANGTAGVLIKVDRLVQVEKGRQDNKKLIMAGVVTLIVSGLLQLGVFLFKLLPALETLHQLQQKVIK